MPANTQRIEILSGWKEIANYLRKAVRTVQRYERECGLPIRRPAARSKGSVIATKAELDGWVSATPIRETFLLPQSAVDNHARLAELHRNVKDLHQLRVEATLLRQELHKAFQVLRATVAALADRSPIQTLDSPSERRLIADVLTFDPNKRKPH